MVAPLLAAGARATAGRSVSAREVERAQERVQQARSQRASALERQQAVNEKYTELAKKKPTFFRYMPALTVAGLKDLLDLVLIGSIPVLGWVVTICFSILIFFLLLFTRANSSLLEMRWLLRRIIIIIGGTVVEGFFVGVNFFPIETALVFIIYFLDKHASEKQIRVLGRVGKYLK